MLVLLISLVLFLPNAGASTAPQTPRISLAPLGRPVRVSLVNISGKRRQLLLTTGTLTLPIAQRIDIDSHVGATLHIVSDTNQNLHEDIVIHDDSDTRILQIL